MANWDLAWGALLHRSLSSPVDVSERLDQVRLPVLVITGDQDKLVKVADTQRVAQALPQATLAVLPDCGHAPQEECPAAFMGAVTPGYADGPQTTGCQNDSKEWARAARTANPSTEQTAQETIKGRMAIGAEAVAASVLRLV